MKDIHEAISAQEAQMKAIDERAEKGKRKWFLIMFALMALEIGAAVVASLISLQALPVAVSIAFLAILFTTKTCVGQVGKVLERQRAERENMDTSGRFARFNWGE